MYLDARPEVSVQPGYYTHPLELSNNTVHCISNDHELMYRGEQLDTKEYDHMPDYTVRSARTVTPVLKHSIQNQAKSRPTESVPSLLDVPSQRSIDQIAYPNPIRSQQLYEPFATSCTPTSDRTYQVFPFWPAIAYTPYTSTSHVRQCERPQEWCSSPVHDETTHSVTSTWTSSVSHTFDASTLNSLVAQSETELVEPRDASSSAKSYTSPRKHRRHPHASLSSAQQSHTQSKRYPPSRWWTSRYSASSPRLMMRLSPLPGMRALPDKRPSLACHFCRGRKIACGPPPPEILDRTCKYVSCSPFSWLHFCSARFNAELLYLCS